MGKKPMKDGDTEVDGLFIRLDSVSQDRVKRQAARKHGTTKGYLQDYIRAAIMAALEKDEATMRTSAAPEVEAE